nr:ribonuclease H-like domain-containing protein [Tanacetum cinerariifolium]
MESNDTLSLCSYLDEQDVKQMLKRTKILKGSCLSGLSALKSNFTRKYVQGITKIEFERAFSHIFGEDVDTFTRTFSQNMDTLEQQLTKETIIESNCQNAFKIQKRLDDKKLQIQECTVQEVKAADVISEDKAQERCMISYRLLHSHLKLLSNNDLKGTRTEYGFKRAFATLFGQDLETFTGTMFLNMDQLEKQLDNEEFQEIGSMASFRVLEIHFQAFIISRNDAHADDADIRPIYNEEPMAEPRFDSQVDVNNDLSKPVTTHYLPMGKESACAKPHHMIAPGSSRYNSNDMVHNHYLEEAKKKTQESGRNSRPSVMPSARSQSISNVGLRWVPTGKIFTSSTTKVNSEPTNGSNEDITNQYECKQTLDVSASTSINVQKEQSLDLSVELESLFGPSFDEYFNGENQVISKPSAVTTADASNKRQQQPDSTSSTSTLATTVTADGNFNFVEVEYCGVANAVVETCWLRNLLRELHAPLSSATLVYCDNVSAVYFFSNSVQHQRMKHLDIDIHFVRDLVVDGQVQVLHVLPRYQQDVGNNAFNGNLGQPTGTRRVLVYPSELIRNRQVSVILRGANDFMLDEMDRPMDFIAASNTTNGRQCFHKVTNDLKVISALTIMVEEMKVIGAKTLRKGDSEDAFTEVMGVVSYSDGILVLLFMGGGMGAGKSTILKEILKEYETEIKDDDAYKEELLDYEDGGKKAPYSAAMLNIKFSGLAYVNVIEVVSAPDMLIEDVSDTLFPVWKKVEGMIGIHEYLKNKEAAKSLRVAPTVVKYLEGSSPLITLNDENPRWLGTMDVKWQKRPQLNLIGLLTKDSLEKLVMVVEAGGVSD